MKTFQCKCGSAEYYNVTGSNVFACKRCGNLYGHDSTGPDDILSPEAWMDLSVEQRKQITALQKSITRMVGMRGNDFAVGRVHDRAQAISQQFPDIDPVALTHTATMLLAIAAQNPLQDMEYEAIMEGAASLVALAAVGMATQEGVRMVKHALTEAVKNEPR